MRSTAMRCAAGCSTWTRRFGRDTGHVDVRAQRRRVRRNLPQVALVLPSSVPLRVIHFAEKRIGERSAAVQTHNLVVRQRRVARQR